MSTIRVLALYIKKKFRYLQMSAHQFSLIVCLKGCNLCSMFYGLLKNTFIQISKYWHTQRMTQRDKIVSLFKHNIRKLNSQLLKSSFHHCTVENCKCALFFCLLDRGMVINDPLHLTVYPTSQKYSQTF